jgi:hypothetical protein
MANDMFKLPGQVGEGPLNDALRIADSFQYTPEKQPAPFQFIKDIENGMDASVEAALELSRKKSKFGWMNSRLQLEGITKTESEMIGELFGKGKGHRFWFEHRSPTAHAFESNVGHWYHTRPVIYTNGKVGELTLHYLTSPDRIEKRWNGGTYPIDIAELQDFCRAVLAARDLTREKLYPLDDSIHELELEIEEEHIVQPTTEEKMFSQAAVQRMIDEYRAKQALENTNNDNKNDYDLAA